MANPAAQADGSQTATIGTEHSLATIAVAGTFWLEVDMAAMRAGDALEVRWKSKTRTGGTQTGGDVYYREGDKGSGTMVGQSAKLITDLIPNVNTDSSSIEFTLKQTVGTGRAFPWQIFKYT